MLEHFFTLHKFAFSISSFISMTAVKQNYVKRMGIGGFCLRVDL